MKKWSNRFILSAGVILLLTGVIKVLSSFGNSEILRVADPISGMQFQYLLLIVGTVEIVVAISCFTKLPDHLRLTFLAFMVTSFLIYRTGLWLMGWHRPCPCLGGFTDLVHISMNTSDILLKAILTYLAVGITISAVGTTTWLKTLSRRGDSQISPLKS